MPIFVITNIIDISFEKGSFPDDDFKLAEVHSTSKMKDDLH